MPKQRDVQISLKISRADLDAIDRAAAAAEMTRSGVLRLGGRELAARITREKIETTPRAEAS